mmetsp:Transcript_14700/g.34143  ORF Transcript_14700/g.34143 Transcript_14700/m.34143 type:complete len:438 (+) Transcript_14700:125-1438(+)
MSSDDPGTEHYNIGDTLRHKGFYDDAVTELQHAITLQETRSGSKNLKVAATHYSIGLTYRALKDFKFAMKHLNRAKEIYEIRSKDDPKKFKEQIKNCKLNIARTHHTRGVFYQRSGDYDDSVLEHRKAIALRESILGPSHLETARSHYVMGCALSDRGNFDEALAELRRALRSRLKIFGKDHLDVIEVVDNIGTVMHAMGIDSETTSEYKTNVLRSLEYEYEGDIMCRKGDLEYGVIFYQKAVSLEMQFLGDLHPTTCDLYLRIAEALGDAGDLEGSLVEYKSAITIYENLMGKFHVKMAQIYSNIAGVLMDKGEYETALSFYAKAYGIFDATLGLHDDTKQALMNVKLAAEKNRAAKSSMDILVKAEEKFKKRHPQLSATDEDSGEESGDANEENDGDPKKKKKGDKKKKKKKKKKKSEEAKEEKEPDPEPEPDII